MDKRKSILNVTVSVGFRLITIIMSILVRRALIHHCGNDVNGLNSLYLSIIGILSVAELGVGSAITFCMYRPIVEGDEEKVGALYHLFRRWYLLVGSVILLCGLAITPFVHLLAKDYRQLDVNFYSTFLLVLLSTVLTYLFAAKTALINAYKNNYITTAISAGGILLQYVLQLIALRLAGTFFAYLLCKSLAVLVQWAATEAVAGKKHKSVLQAKGVLDRDSRRELSEKIRAMFMHKIGTLLVNTVDSVVISLFVGVVALGQYSNYTAIQSSMDSVLILCFSSLISVFGHMYVSGSKEAARKYCDFFHLINFMIGAVFYLGYYAVIDDLVSALFGEGLVAPRSVAMVITLNGFVQFMRRSTLAFRDATGMFYYDRWKPLLEGAVNIVLSVMLVRRIGVVGVIAATILTNLLICHIVEPYVLYVHAFETTPVKYYIQNYGMIAAFCGALYVLDRLMTETTSWTRRFFQNGMVSVGVSIGLCGLIALVNYRDCR